MFDNPNEELKKLEDQLLAVEAPTDDFESFYSDILKEFGPDAAAPAARKPAAQKTSGQKQSASGHTKKTSGKSSKKAGKKSGKKKKKGIKGLVITLCLESAGIIAIIAWWVLRIL